MKQTSSRSRVRLSAGPERLPSPGAPRVTLARAAQDPPPASRLCRHGASFRRLLHLPRLAPRKARPAAGSRAHHPGPGRPDAACRLLQSPRFSSTTTEPDPLTLHAPQRVAPLRGATAGSLALTRERRPSCLEIQGPAWSYEHASSSPYDCSPESFAPNRSARTPHVAEPCPHPAGEAGHGGQGQCPHGSAVEQRTRRRPCKGSRSAHFREEDPGPRTRGAFLYDGRPGGRCRYPQVVTSLWRLYTTPYVPPRAPFGVDVPSGPRRVDCP